MKKQKQRWIALTVVASLVVLVAGWFLLVQPKRTDVKNLKADAVSAEAHNGQLQTQLAMLKSQAKLIGKENAALAAAKEKIPTTTDLPNLLRQLSAAATSADVDITSLTPSTPTALSAAPGVSVVSLSLGVHGTYFPIEQFVNSLETLDRALMVTSLTVATGANTTGATSGSTASTMGGSPELSVSITAQVFTGNLTQVSSATSTSNTGKVTS